MFTSLLAVYRVISKCAALKILLCRHIVISDFSLTSFVYDKCQCMFYFFCVICGIGSFVSCCGFTFGFYFKLAFLRIAIGFDPPSVLSLSDAVSVSDSAAFSRSSEMLVAVFFPVTTASVVT